MLPVRPTGMASNRYRERVWIGLRVVMRLLDRLIVTDKLQSIALRIGEVE